MGPRHDVSGCRDSLLAGVGGELRLVAPIHSGPVGFKRKSEFLGDRADVGTASLQAPDEPGAKKWTRAGTFAKALGRSKLGHRVVVSGAGQCSTSYPDDSEDAPARTSGALSRSGSSDVVRAHVEIYGTARRTEIYEPDCARICPHHRGWPVTISSGHIHGSL